jgi:hypothetical protein
LHHSKIRRVPTFMKDGEKQTQIKNPHTEKVQGFNIENII